jgi:acetyltransferase-like isoleucine patch superfamily enzyme
MDEYSILGDHVQVFNVDKVHLKAYACVSQFANIYPSSRDMNNDDTFVTSQPIVIGEKAWVASYSYLGMGSNIGREAVIGAGTVVRSAIPPYSMVIGNPAKVTGFRYTLDEIIEREKTVYKDEEQIPEDLLKKNYDKYFLNRLKEIKEFTKL